LHRGRETFKFVRLEDCLCLKEARSGRRFLAEFEERQLERLCFGRSSRAGKKTGGSFELLSREIKTAFEALYGFKELNRIEIENSFGLLVVTEADMVAGKSQDIGYSQRGSAQEVTLQGKTVPVAAGQLQQRFDPFAEQQAGSGKR
jgi:hypothetical protein